MQYEFTVKPSHFGGTWYEGYVEGYYVHARVFDEPSKFGINDGRISALMVVPKKGDGLFHALVNYDRGWDGGLPAVKYRAVIEHVYARFHDHDIDWAYEERKYREGSQF
ncbi:50S ribosomal protein L10 [Alicyclobacillus hesperidum URH17-3-68]|uniref:DUF7678 domain-containing protein n=1 Tax=Alicyclobacillus hesperidum TaxID=89784 RepID=UPI000281B86D|nr:hypothetical protein [Alicyclobacillus hesperidum]EJY56440.1 50S ribosomal protein L10 [Alicyclobacillus hesperidum URH17-3-68]